MKLTFAQLMLQIAIYCSLLRTFAFIKEGAGYIEPTTIVLLLAGIYLGFRKVGELIRGKRRSLVLVFGTKPALQSIFVFMGIAISSTFIAKLIGDSSTSFYKSAGVFISILVFLTFYSVTSAVNTGAPVAHHLFKAYMRTAVIVSTAVLVEALIDQLTGRDWMELFLTGISNQLPYPHFVTLSYGETASRYRGLMLEPGDVGTFTLPAVAALLAKFSKNMRRMKISDVAKILLTILSNVLTASLTGLAVLLGVLAFFTPLIVRSYLSRGTTKKSLLSLNKGQLLQFLVVLAFTCFAVITLYSYLPFEVRDRLRSIGELFSSQANSALGSSDLNVSVAVIFYSFEATVQSLQHNWLLGVGLGGHGESYDAVTSLAYNSSAIGLNRQDAYSMLLRLLSEVGVLGTISFLSIFWLRLSQRRKFIVSFMKKLQPQYAEIGPWLNQSDKIFFMIHSATVTEIIFIMLNEPTFFNPLPMVLLGICWKVSYLSSYREAASKHL